jgi:hypothetical protein
MEDHYAARAEVLAKPVPEGLKREQYAACMNTAFDAD